MLYEEFDRKKKEVFIKSFDDFSALAGNLNPNFQMREYQKIAFGRFFYYMSDKYSEEYNRPKPTHLLFNMATGSGKTLVMAGNILYLYKKGYRNFLFFTRLTNIIEKTKDNFLNSGSSKYLFSQKIIIDNKEVKIRVVESFDEANKDDINICFNSTAGLHGLLKDAKENAVSEDDFENIKVVLLADEAHNNQVSTAGEKEEEKENWENTIIEKIFKKNKENILLEFTATMDLDDKNIKQKYEDKIIYKYNLKEFRLDGFSKEVKVLQAELSPLDRALNAVVLSQYRRKVAGKHGKALKPVVLFKSQKIIESKKFYEDFLTKIKNLKVADLQKIEKASGNIENEDGETALVKAFQYFRAEKISLGDLVKELKNDFSEDKCVEVNSKEESEQKQLLINNLEDENNGIRAIFAVDKLNEGWDVLNLFDIVRINEGRDAKNNVAGPTTMREAQLIGRGARYWPFKFADTDEKFKRKYDEPKNEKENEMKILEELYYHSRKNPKYIQELRTELKKTGIVPDTSMEVDIKVKESIKNKRFWKEGLIYLNEVIKNNRQDVNSLKNAGVAVKYEYQMFSAGGFESAIFGEKNMVVRETKPAEFSFQKIGYCLTHKTMNMLPFYYFDNLQKYFPNLMSTKEFFRSEKYLAGIKIEIKGEDLYLIDLQKKFDIALTILDKISKDIQNNTFEYQGTKEFYPTKIKDKVKDKKIKVEIKNDGEKEYGKGMKEADGELHLDLQEKDWYVYEENYGTSEEKHLVKFINNSMKKLEEKYEEVYLLRNERLFKIYKFSDGSAMEPDFVLFLREKNQKEYLTYQMFIEAKGDDRMTNEDSRWKENFLLEIEKEGKAEIKNENDEFKLVGMPLYNKNDEEVFLEKFNPYLK